MQVTSIVNSNTTISKNFRILVAEDNPQFQKFYIDVLRMFGFEKVVVVSNGQEALDRLEVSPFPFDLIITDWEMPEMSGIEFLEKTRKTTESQSFFTPILFATGMAQLRHVERARDLGANEFLSKPFTIDEFRGRLVAVFAKPREFIVSDFFSGPCRRRRQAHLPESIEADRRKVA